MSKPNRKRYKLTELIQEVKVDHPPIEVETEDGSVFEIPPAQLWPDKAITLATQDPVASARMILGDRYDDFAAAGGSAMLLHTLLERDAGVSMGKSSASAVS